MMIRPGFARWNSRVGFLLFLAADAVYDGSREISIIFSRISLSPKTTEVLKQRGTPKKGVGQKLSTFMLRTGTELLERFLRNCNPTLTHVNSKPLIITCSCGLLAAKIPRLLREPHTLGPKIYMLGTKY